ncbi:MAG: chemotaxis protein CheD [Firmicutes bacterium]|nr:chemotaxis protein CheD [Bacillota bacterium]
METTYVYIADLAVSQNEGLLVTIGLGSCVGVALYDAKRKIAGLVHILLNDSKQYLRDRSNQFNPAKFADTAIPELIKAMEERGASRGALVAHLAGGSQLFDYKFDGVGIGQKNIEAARAKLKELGIAILSEDTGGDYGRTMKINAGSGEVIISSLSREKKLTFINPRGVGSD